MIIIIVIRAAKICKKYDLNYTRLMSKCMDSALRASSYIFCRRHKDWITPEPLYFYLTTVVLLVSGL